MFPKLQQYLVVLSGEGGTVVYDGRLFIVDFLATLQTIRWWCWGVVYGWRRLGLTQSMGDRTFIGWLIGDRVGHRGTTVVKYTNKEGWVSTVFCDDV